ncbi:MAG: metalloregulator ArsR/SmtB family transcription factor [Ilumatobacteraceae bacterium]
MGDRAAKNALYDAFAGVAKALAGGRRAEIVDVLAQGERSVEQVAGEIGQSVANTSHHLRAMAGAGVLRTRREGTRIVYMLASDSVGDLWAAMRDIAEQHVSGIAELAEAYVGNRAGLEPVTRRDLQARIKAGDVVVLDVRPTAEFEAGHIPGARSVPIGELRRLRSLPKDSEIVAYCRGPYCVYADNAVRQLRRRGFTASRLEDGFPEWKRAGLPVAAGARG